MPKWAIGIDDGFSMTRPTGIGRHTECLLSALAVAPTFSVCHVRHAWLEPIRPLALRRAMYLAWLASGIPETRLRRTLDLVHFTNYHVPPQKARGLRYAATIHDLVPFRVPDTKSRTYTAYLRRSIVHALRTADVVFAPSSAVRDEIVAEFRVDRQGIHVLYVPGTLLPLPASVARANVSRRFPELRDAPFALFVGTLERRKNLIALLRGLALLPSALDGVDLVLAGRPGPGYAEIAEEVTAVDARRHRVHVLTDCSDDDLRSLYTDCRAFVFPSVYEGYGIPLLEAMQCGAPIVASDVSASRELTAGAALIVGPTADQIAEGLAAVLESDDLRGTLVARGHARVADFTLEQTSRQLVEGYGTVLAPRR